MTQGYEADCFAGSHAPQTDMAQVEENIVALHSCQAGTSAPSNTAQGTLWLDTDNHQLKIMNEDNDTWITLMNFNTALDVVNFLSAGIVDNANATAMTIDSDEIVTFEKDPLIPDEEYGSGWDGSLEPPTKNAVYDKIDSLSSGMYYIHEIVLSGDAEAEFDDEYITDDYDVYEFRLINCVPASDGAHFNARTSYDNGSNYADGASAYTDESGAQTKMQLASTVGSGSDEGGVSGSFTMIDPSDTNYDKQFMCNVVGSFVGIGRRQSFRRNNDSAINAIKFYYSTGNIESGIVRLYGLKSE